MICFPRSPFGKRPSADAKPKVEPHQIALRGFADERAGEIQFCTRTEALIGFDRAASTSLLAIRNQRAFRLDSAALLGQRTRVLQRVNADSLALQDVQPLLDRLLVLVQQLSILGVDHLLRETVQEYLRSLVLGETLEIEKETENFIWFRLF